MIQTQTNSKTREEKTQVPFKVGDIAKRDRELQTQPNPIKEAGALSIKQNFDGYLSLFNPKQLIGRTSVGVTSITGGLIETTGRDILKSDSVENFGGSLLEKSDNTQEYLDNLIGADHPDFYREKITNPLKEGKITTARVLKELPTSAGTGVTFIALNLIGFKGIDKALKAGKILKSDKIRRLVANVASSSASTIAESGLEANDVYKRSIENGEGEERARLEQVRAFKDNAELIFSGNFVQNILFDMVLMKGVPKSFRDAVRTSLSVGASAVVEGVQEAGQTGIGERASEGLESTIADLPADLQTPEGKFSALMGAIVSLGFGGGISLISNKGETISDQKALEVSDALLLSLNEKSGAELENLNIEEKKGVVKDGVIGAIWGKNPKISPVELFASISQGSKNGSLDNIIEIMQDGGGSIKSAVDSDSLVLIPSIADVQFDLTNHATQLQNTVGEAQQEFDTEKGNIFLELDNKEEDINLKQAEKSNITLSDLNLKSVEDVSKLTPKQAESIQKQSFEGVYDDAGRVKVYKESTLSKVFDNKVGEITTFAREQLVADIKQSAPGIKDATIRFLSNDFITTNTGGRARGVFFNNVITLAEARNRSTLSHEVGHLLETMLSKEEWNQVKGDIRKNHNDIFEAKLAIEQNEEIAYKEAFADIFMEQKLNEDYNTTSFIKRALAKIKAILQDILDNRSVIKTAIRKYTKGETLTNRFRQEIQNEFFNKESQSDSFYKNGLVSNLGVSLNQSLEERSYTIDEINEQIDNSDKLTLYQVEQKEFSQNGYTTKLIQFLEQQDKVSVKRHVFDQWLKSSQYGESKKQPLKKEELIFADEILKEEQFKEGVNLQDYIDIYASKLFKIETSAQEGYAGFGMDYLGAIEPEERNPAIVVEIETDFGYAFGTNHYDNETKISARGDDVLSHYRSFFKNGILYLVEIQSDFTKGIARNTEGIQMVDKNQKFIFSAIEEYATVTKKDKDAQVKKTFQYNNGEHKLSIYRFKDEIKLSISHDEYSKYSVSIDITQDLNTDISRRLLYFKEEIALQDKLKNVYLPITFNEIDKGSNLPDDQLTQKIRLADHITIAKVEFGVSSGNDTLIGEFPVGSYQIGDFVNDSEGHGYIIGVLKNYNSRDTGTESYRFVDESEITKDQLEIIKKVHKKTPSLYSEEIIPANSTEYIKALKDGGIPESELSQIVEYSRSLLIREENPDIDSREELEKVVEKLDDQQKNVIKQYARGGLIYNALKKHYGEVTHVIDEFGNGWWEVTRPDTTLPKELYQRSEETNNIDISQEEKNQAKEVATELNANNEEITPGTLNDAIIKQNLRGDIAPSPVSEISGNENIKVLYIDNQEDKPAPTLYQKAQKEFNQGGYTTRLIKFLEQQKQEKVKRHVFEQWLKSTQYGEAKNKPLKKEELIFAKEILREEQFKTEINLRDYINEYAGRLFKIETSTNDEYSDFGMDNLGLNLKETLKSSFASNDTVVVEMETNDFDEAYGTAHYENVKKFGIKSADVLSHYRSFFKDDILHVVEVQSDFIKKASKGGGAGYRLTVPHKEFVYNAIEEYENLVKKDKNANLNKTFQYNGEEYNISIYNNKDNTLKFLSFKRDVDNIYFSRMNIEQDFSDRFSKYLSFSQSREDFYSKFKNSYLPITLNEINKGSSLPENQRTQKIRLADQITSAKVEFSMSAGEATETNFEPDSYKIGNLVDSFTGHVYIIGKVKNHNHDNGTESYRVIDEQNTLTGENNITKEQLKIIKKAHETDPSLSSSALNPTKSSKYIKSLIEAGMSEDEALKVVDESIYLIMGIPGKETRTREDLEKAIEDLDSTQQNVVKQYAPGGTVYNAFKKKFPNMKHIIEENGNGWYEADRQEAETIPKELFQREDPIGNDRDSIASTWSLNSTQLTDLFVKGYGTSPITTTDKPVKDKIVETILNDAITQGVEVLDITRLNPEGKKLLRDYFQSREEIRPLYQENNGIPLEDINPNIDNVQINEEPKHGFKRKKVVDELKDKYGINPLDRKEKNNWLNKILFGEEIRGKIKEFGRSGKEGFSKMFEVTSNVLDKISPDIKYKIRLFIYAMNTGTIEDEKIALPFAKQFKTLTPDERQLFFILSQTDKISPDDLDRFLKNKQMVSSYNKIRKMLDRLYQVQIDMGFDVGYEEGYFPRTVKNLDGLRKYLDDQVGEETMARLIRKENERRETAGEEVMTEGETAVFLDNYLFGTIMAGKVNTKKLPSAESRSIEKIGTEITQYYANPIRSLQNYIGNVNGMIAVNQLFGKNTQLMSNKKGINLDTSIGKLMLQRDILDLPIDKQRRLTEELKSILKPEKSNSFVSNTKGLIYIDTLGSPLNAITQLGDIGFVLYKNGIVNTTKGLLNLIKGEGVIPQDVGVDEILKEYDEDPGSMIDVFAKLTKITGFRSIDFLGKKLHLTSSLVTLKEELSNPKTKDKVMKELNLMFNGNEKLINKVVKDINNSNMTYDVKFVLFNKLSDIQPITIMEVPNKYRTTSWGRLFYVLKTFTIKQMNIVHADMFKKIKDGSLNINTPEGKEEFLDGSKNLLRYALFFTLLGVTTDELKDLLKGDIAQVERDEIWDAVLRSFGTSRYISYEARKQGIGTAVIGQILPPRKLVDNVYEDIRKGEVKRVYRSIPVVGEFYYQWFADSEKERRDDLNLEFDFDAFDFDVSELDLDLELEELGL